MKFLFGGNTALLKNLVFLRVSSSRLFGNRVLLRVSGNPLLENFVFLRVSSIRLFGNLVCLRVSCNTLLENLTPKLTFSLPSKRAFRSPEPKNIQICSFWNVFDEEFWCLAFLEDSKFALNLPSNLQN